MSRCLTRAAAVHDYDGCCSIHGWQYRHAIDSHTRWIFQSTIPDDYRVAIYNWGAGSLHPWIFRPVDQFEPSDYPVRHADGSLAAVYACSVLDRIDEPRRFLRQLHAALVPGGLLFATFAIWDAHGPDCAFGHQLRRRIYGYSEWKRLIEDVRDLGYQTFGGVDLRYTGDLLGDHSLGALVLVKELR